MIETVIIKESKLTNMCFIVIGACVWLLTKKVIEQDAEIKDIKAELEKIESKGE